MLVKILVVDDNKEISKMLCDWLGATLGYDITCVTNVTDAIYLLDNLKDKDELRLVFMDILLGRGLNDCIVLYSHVCDNFDNALIVLITALDYSDKYLDMFKTEDIAILHKPFTLQAVADIVNEIEM